MKANMRRGPGSCGSYCNPFPFTKSMHKEKGNE